MNVEKLVPGKGPEEDKIPFKKKKLCVRIKNTIKNMTLEQILIIVLVILIIGLIPILVWYKYRVNFLKFKNKHLDQQYHNLYEKYQGLKPSIEALEKEVQSVSATLNEKKKNYYDKKFYYEKLSQENNALTHELRCKEDPQKQSTLISEFDQKIVETMTRGTVKCICYRYTTDGQTPSDFHKRCDHLQGTLTIIRTEDEFVFGGYTSQSWSGNEEKKDNKAFLFSTIIKTIFPVKKDYIAINAKPILFPTFGMDDIYLSSESFSTRSEFQSYEMVGMFIGGLNGGNEKFKIKEMEVFELYGEDSMT